MVLAGHVFAYGSLAHDLAAAGPPRARLRGARRTWGVAMDNRRAIPGYKVWLDPADGTRPALHVAFLDLADDAEATVAGLCVAMTAESLAAADARERNYARVEVSARVEPVPPGGGPVWAYRGSAAGRARLATAAAAGDAVVARPYLDAVRATFNGAIPPPPLPVRDLVRRDVPPRPPRAR
jgi:hypothetical protein